MRFTVLGPLSITGENGTSVPLTGVKAQLVLAKLLLARGRVVPLGELINLLWGNRPPRSARANMYGYLTIVRRWVGGERMRHTLPGYALTLAPDELDLDCFLRLRARGLELRNAGDVAEAARQWQAALTLWQGDPLAGIPADHLTGQLSELNELRASTMEDFLDAEITLGRAGDLIAELHRLITEHPLRERLHGIYLRALYAAGRQADALRAYQTARTTLMAELAVEPGPALRRLHRAVLDGDPAALDLPVAPVSAAQVEFSPLCQLPADTADFVGRTDLLVLMEQWLRARTGLEVLALCGMPGAGKTTLAIRLAHRTREFFPDGQLFVTLTTPEGKPREPSAILAELLRNLDLPEPAIPAGLDQRAAAFRARIADRKILLVLDDAANETQVRPLLPGTGGCAVVITGRHRLAVLPGARPVQVDVLEPDEAARLFASSVGTQRIGIGDAATARILDFCGGLPLALRLASARLLIRPDWGVDDLANGLTAGGRGLDLLEAGDLALRASFDRSYLGLPAHARLVLRRFAYAGAPDLASWAVHALAGDDANASAADLDRALDQLVTASLMEPIGVDGAGQYRYRIHGLLRRYAGERAAVEEPDPDAERHAILRLLQECLGRIDGTSGRWQIAERQTLRAVARQVREFDRGRTSPMITRQLAILDRAATSGELELVSGGRR
jgi:DNA-binding SARP family transcriptional activator